MKYFRNEIPEVLEIKTLLDNWSREEWIIFSNDRYLTLPTLEYAYLLFDAGFNPKTDAAKKATELLYPE